jgi:hypothetical protein
MLGFKNFSSAAVTLAGVELLRPIYKGPLSLSKLWIKNQATPCKLACSASAV